MAATPPPRTRPPRVGRVRRTRAHSPHTAHRERSGARHSRRARARAQVNVAGDSSGAERDSGAGAYS
eukprot:4452037-Prymnesium_polylepis.1